MKTKYFSNFMGEALKPADTCPPFVWRNYTPERRAKKEQRK
jgi:hypothetical protein